MWKQVLYTLIIALGAVFINLHWDSVDIVINAYKKGDPAKVDSVFGPLIGQTGVTREGRTFYKFTSIPYARSTRFEAPTKYGKWDGVLDATKKSPVCSQVDFTKKSMFGQEDCLYLNVYTPNIGKRHKNNLLPTLIWIYGGNFMFGSTDLYNPEYFLDEDVILVTFNYRTNILGFLNTGDAVVRGNQGLKDQVAAFQWVQDAIQDFGGNPNRVTIFGNSAGGASVSYHMISNMSKGLFHNAISQSGTNLCAWAKTQNPIRHAFRFGSMVGCPTTTSLELVQCLKEKPIEELMNIHFEILDIFHDEEALFSPSIEFVDENTDQSKIFLSESPTKLMKEGKFYHIPWINGVNGDEGCFRSAVIVSDPNNLRDFNENWMTYISNLNFLPKNNPTALSKIRAEYFPQRKNESESLNPNAVHEITRQDLTNISNVIGDRWFLSCSKESTIYHSKYAPVYLYYFNKKVDLSYGYILEATTISFFPPWISLPVAYLKYLFYRHILGVKEIHDYGVCHTDEIQQLFMLTPELNIPVNSDEFRFSQAMIKLWVSFAKNGKPDDFLGVTWKNYDGISEPLMYLKMDENPAMIEEPFTARLEFWNNLNLPKN